MLKEMHTCLLCCITASGSLVHAVLHSAKFLGQQAKPKFVKLIMVTDLCVLLGIRSEINNLMPLLNIARTLLTLKWFWFEKGIFIYSAACLPLCCHCRRYVVTPSHFSFKETNRKQSFISWLLPLGQQHQSHLYVWPLELTSARQSRTQAWCWKENRTESGHSGGDKQTEDTKGLLRMCKL